ncbi:Uu.00g013430.m01.CDS01 [Anthostomella pinea]|uniref:Uu.00g013430.m01.CDS01 n=1 Tax=Anthostomella pinea TaxID=933095 RepID=A0AAI8VY42_9PEZI|nr:Uu.00g013430.m01.CDS01 [Anthostomella pinea]
MAAGSKNPSATGHEAKHEAKETDTDPEAVELPRRCTLGDTVSQDRTTAPPLTRKKSNYVEAKDTAQTNGFLNAWLKDPSNDIPYSISTTNPSGRRRSNGSRPEPHTHSFNLQTVSPEVTQLHSATPASQTDAEARSDWGDLSTAWSMRLSASNREAGVTSEGFRVHPHIQLGDQFGHPVSSLPPGAHPLPPPPPRQLQQLYPWGVNSPSQQPIFTYPPLNGSTVQALHPALLQQHIASTRVVYLVIPQEPPATQLPQTPCQHGCGPGISQPTVVQSSFVQPATPPHTGVEIPPAHNSPGGGGCNGNVFECRCGPSCWCVGCITHPFNEATQEYIRSAQAQLLLEEADEAALARSWEQPFTNNTLRGGESEMAARLPVQLNASLMAGDGEPNLPTDGYFFVTY